MNAVEITDLHFNYPDGTVALRGLSCSIPAGAKLAILGPNGAGKSTLLLHLNGIHVPQRGSVLVNGRSILASDFRWARGPVGLVFQDPDDQVFAPTVWEDVAFGPRNQGLQGEELAARVNEALFGVGMQDVANKAPHHLSYGQRKRVAIAGVLAMKPSIVVLDEPTAYLDPRGADELFAVLERLHKGGTTLIVATHDVDLAAEWADSLLIVKSGRTLATGPTSLLADPDLVEEANLRLPTVVRLLRGLVSEPLPVTVPAARDLIGDLLPKNTKS